MQLSGLCSGLYTPDRPVNLRMEDGRVYENVTSIRISQHGRGVTSLTITIDGSSIITKNLSSSEEIEMEEFDGR